MKALVLVALVGCAVAPGPAVRISVVDAFGNGAELPEYLDGAQAWEPLGFDVDFGDHVDDECPRLWHEGDADCQITIDLVRKPRLIETDGVTALSDRNARGIAIDPRVADPLELRVAVAHEVGHILLDTPRHTQGGIMGGSSTVMLDVDYELACEAIGRGC